MFVQDLNAANISHCLSTARGEARLLVLDNPSSPNLIEREVVIDETRRSFRLNLEVFLVKSKLAAEG